MRKINNQTMRENNVRMLLNTIRKSGPVSRAELAKGLGLTSPAVTNIVSGLLRDGLLVETGLSDAALGRKPILLGINPSVRSVLGMVFTTESATVVLSDFSANILCREERAISPMAGKNAILATLIDCAKTCMWRTSTRREQILGIGIAAPGPMDTRAGVLVNPPNFPDWHNVPICAIMEDALGIPAVLDKETNAAAMAEYYYSVQEEFKTMFYILLLKNSIGGSVMLGGGVVHGFEDGAGDIGHMLVDINGPRCSCGQFGCLECIASGNALLSEARARLKSMSNASQPVPCRAESLTLEDVFRLSAAGDPLFREVVDRAARMIAVAVGNVVSLISPSLVVVGGTLTDLCPALVPSIRSYVHSRSYPECVKRIRIEPSALGDSGSALGAVVLALDAFQTRLATSASMQP